MAAATSAKPSHHEDSECEKKLSSANPLSSNPYSSLARAASDTSGEDEGEEEDDASDYMDSELSVDQATAQVKKLSIQKSKPGAQRDGTGRKE